MAMRPETPERNSVTINPRQLLALYLEGKHAAVAAEFIRVLAFLDGFSYAELAAEAKSTLDLIVENLLYFFTKPDFTLDDKTAENFIRLNPVISNAVAISAFRNTDAQLEIIRGQQNNLLRILPLLSVRNRLRFDYSEIFRLQPRLASLWYTMYFQSAEAPVTELILENLTRHLKHVDPNFTFVGPEVTYAFSFSTYVDIDADRPLKETLNAMMKKALAGVAVTNRPHEEVKGGGRKRIAIASGRWIPTSSVYKAMYSLVAALKDDYDLTLIELMKEEPKADRSLFDDVRLVRIADGRLQCASVLENDFDLMFYPDLGMAMEERHLANLRLAPIQVMGLGHSVSTFGAEIDYFISGRDVEVAKNPEANYSERLVLIPGTGLDPTWPPFAKNEIRTEARSGTRSPDGAFVINCSWSAAQCRYPHLLLAKRILDECRAQNPERRIVFRIFAGMGVHRHNAFIPFKNEIASVLGEEHVDVSPDLPFQEYMAKMEEGEFTLDAYPIGGYNTVVDTLSVGLPFVSLEGGRFYNRVASTVLRQAGLKELIATGDEQYVALALRLVNDDKYRKRLQQKIARLDVNKLLAQPDTPRYFARAIAYLIANDRKLKAETAKGKRAPIVIK